MKKPAILLVVTIISVLTLTSCNGGNSPIKYDETIVNDGKYTVQTADEKGGKIYSYPAVDKLISSIEDPERKELVILITSTPVKINYGSAGKTLNDYDKEEAIQQMYIESFDKTVELIKLPIENLQAKAKDVEAQSKILEDTEAVLNAFLGNLLTVETPYRWEKTFEGANTPSTTATPQGIASKTGQYDVYRALYNEIIDESCFDDFVAGGQMWRFDRVCYEKKLTQRLGGYEIEFTGDEKIQGNFKALVIVTDELQAEHEVIVEGIVTLIEKQENKYLIDFVRITTNTDKAYRDF